MNTHSFDIYTISITGNSEQLKQQIVDIAPGQYQAVVLDIISDEFQAADLSMIIELFAQKNLVVVGVCTTREDIREFAIFSNIALFDKETQSIAPAPRLCTLDAKPTLVRTDVKNNEQVYAKGNDLVVLGDVASGAEVLSDKNVTIYGGGYGKIFAGITDASAYIYTHFFSAKLVCINGIYREFTKIPQEYLNQPMLITIKNNALDFQILT